VESDTEGIIDEDDEIAQQLIGMCEFDDTMDGGDDDVDGGYNG
jgi:hypothetical protein